MSTSEAKSEDTCNYLTASELLHLLQLETEHSESLCRHRPRWNDGEPYTLSFYAQLNFGLIAEGKTGKAYNIVLNWRRLVPEGQEEIQNDASLKLTTRIYSILKFKK